MDLIIVTPAAKGSLSGNRASAERWARLLRGRGHRVRIATAYEGEACDVLVALHAWRSAGAVRAYREARPDGPLVVALGGTDVYRFLVEDPETTLATMRAADALVCLHDLIGEALPADLRGRLHVIHQSARPLGRPRRPAVRRFDVCVIGHLREEKDPLRAAEAARHLPAESRVRIIHLGRAHNDEWAARAHREMVENPRYLWRGQVPAWRVRREYARTRLMAISSVMEGGANVVSEAITAGVPVLASDIAGNVGLLGRDYPGYFPVGDSQALAALLHRAETDSGFLDSLQAHTAARAHLFTPEHEAAAWESVLAGVA